MPPPFLLKKEYGIFMCESYENVALEELQGRVRRVSDALGVVIKNNGRTDTGGHFTYYWKFKRPDGMTVVATIDDLSSLHIYGSLLGNRVGVHPEYAINFPQYPQDGLTTGEEASYTYRSIKGVDRYLIVHDTPLKYPTAEVITRYFDILQEGITDLILAAIPVEPAE